MLLMSNMSNNKMDNIDDTVIDLKDFDKDDILCYPFSMNTIHFAILPT